MRDANRQGLTRATQIWEGVVSVGSGRNAVKRKAMNITCAEPGGNGANVGVRVVETGNKTKFGMPLWTATTYRGSRSSGVYGLPFEKNTNISISEDWLPLGPESNDKHVAADQLLRRLAQDQLLPY